MSPTNLRNNLNCLAREILRRVFVGGSGGKVKSNNDLFLYHLLLGHRVQEATCGHLISTCAHFIKMNLAFPYQWEFYPVNRCLADTPSPVINSFTRHIFTEHLLDAKVPALKKPRF